MSQIEAEKLPRDILEKAVPLRNTAKLIFIALYTCGKPTTATEIAQVLGKSRAYVHMRLIQLCDKGLVRSISEGKRRFFEVVK